MKKDGVRSYKYTIRLNDRDDADLLRVLEGKNVSRAFRDALRGTVNKEQKIDELVTQLVARRLYDILTGFKQLSDLFALAGYAPPVSDLRGAGIPVAAGSTPSESGAPGETNTGPKQGRRPRSAPPEDQVELIGDPAKPEEETAQSEDTDATQRALQKLKECALAMKRQSTPGPPTPPPAEEAVGQAPKDEGQ